MRTTVTLENDLAKQLHDTARRHGKSFKAVLNETVRLGLKAKPTAPRKKFVLPTYNMGVRPSINLNKANVLAAELEDEEIICKLALGK